MDLKEGRLASSPAPNTCCLSKLAAYGTHLALMSSAKCTTLYPMGDAPSVLMRPPAFPRPPRAPLGVSEMKRAGSQSLVQPCPHPSHRHLSMPISRGSWAVFFFCDLGTRDSWVPLILRAEGPMYSPDRDLTYCPHLSQRSHLHTRAINKYMLAHQRFRCIQNHSAASRYP